MRRIMIGRGTIAGLALLAAFGVAACSANSVPSSAGPTTGESTMPAGTASAGSSANVAPAATATPGSSTSAVASADGIEMTVSSTPRSGLLGSTTISATVTVAGAAPAGTLDFLLGIGPADQGQPGSDEQLTIAGPGTYQMPSGFTPTERGAWALTVNFWNQQGQTIISATGMAPNATASSPYPQLVTVVS